MTSYPKSLSKLILLLMFTLCVYRSNAQMFSGRVTDRRGEGIPFATVYIHELKSGISADLNGEFLSKLSPGDTHWKPPHLVLKGSSLLLKWVI